MTTDRKMNEITIFATDSFGAETMVDLNGTEVMENAMVTGEASLVVGVNAPPRMFAAVALGGVSVPYGERLAYRMTAVEACWR